MQKLERVIRVKKKRVPFIALLLCLTLTAGAAVMTGWYPTMALEPVGSEATDAIDAASRAFDAAEPIFEKLKESVAQEIEDYEDESSEDASFEEIEELTRELLGYVDQLDELIYSLSGLPDDMNTSVGKTIRATRDYLIMLRNMSADYAELSQYATNLMNALMVLDGISGDVDSYEELADMIYTTTGEALELLNSFIPPDYISVTQGDLCVRLQEFQDFSVDFYVAISMDDPLRLNSCVYRLSRISTLFEQWAENLVSDLQMQFTQAERRINGPIGQLHDELKSNLALLKAA